MARRWQALASASLLWPSKGAGQRLDMGFGDSDADLLSANFRWQMVTDGLGVALLVVGFTGVLLKFTTSWQPVMQGLEGTGCRQQGLG